VSDSLRTVRQIVFRVRQELANVWITALPPAPRIVGDFIPGLKLSPSGELVEGVTDLADQIRQHRFPIFGLTIDTGPDIRWRRDYTRGIETDLLYFRRVPFLNTPRAGDHKIIWELNRHQHLVVLAQAYLLTGDSRNLEEIFAQLDSWTAANPFHRGTNWASALEVAFRALSWIWIDHYVGREMPSTFRARWLHMLYLHGCHLANNLSTYYSPNNHLVGEALALHALGLYFSGLPRARHWERLGARVMREQMDRQIRGDGSSFEQSTYYQVYLLDMFSLHSALANVGPVYQAKLKLMAEFLHAVAGPSGRLPLLGDDDGGCLSLAPIRPSGGAGNWQSKLFPDAGLAVMTYGDTQAIVDAGPFGALHAGHSHSDTLSIVLRSGDADILIDPGTYTYTGEPAWRERFRSTTAHNTVCIDGHDQAVPRGPFGWTDKPEVTILDWRTNNERDILEAECRYAGFTHRRRVEFRKPDLFLIVDDLSGPPGLHEVEQLWHLASSKARANLMLPDDAELTESWRSSRFGEKHLGPMLRVRRRAELPLRLEARIEVNR
jgi:Heparinase II/III-like protein/Heparinase II/III N-terminus